MNLQTALMIVIILVKMVEKWSNMFQNKKRDYYGMVLLVNWNFSFYSW